MSRNKNTFIFTKNKSGKVILGNSSPTKLLGKGTVDFDIKKIEATNVLLVKGIKKNILSVRKTVDKGNVIVYINWMKSYKKIHWKNYSKGIQKCCKQILCYKDKSMKK